MKPWIRNVLLISTIVLVWAVVLLSVLTYQHNSVRNSEAWVKHSYQVVKLGKEVEADINRLISKQRGFIITGETSFFDEYEIEKEAVVASLRELNTLTDGSPEQQKLVDLLEEQFLALTALLDTRLSGEAVTDEEFGERNASRVRRLSTALQSTLSTLLDTETRLLDERLDVEEVRKAQYDVVLYGGIVLSILLILGLNAAMFRMNYQRQHAEQEHQHMQERLALAMQSTSDGVFDWDLVQDRIWFSRRFKEMLGYEEHELESDPYVVSARIHPDDYDRVWQYIADYMQSGRAEYTQSYRIQHRDGHWIWMQSRGRAVFDENGKAVRLVGSHTNITSMKEIEEQLRQEKEQAVSSNRAKSEFLANMSHEIRTPLNSIIGVSNILAKSRKLDEAQQSKLIRTLQNSSVSLMDLINDVLDFAKIESGELRIEDREFELVPLMEQVISIMSVRAQEKGINFHVDYENLRRRHHKGDELRLRQILLNLVGNAIKFTEKGSVSVKARHEKASLIVEVQDTGIGISKEVQEKLFQKFQQGDSSVNRKYGGSGLGLAISRQLAEMMGGTIMLESEEGQGSTFTLCLPVDGDTSYCEKLSEDKKPAQKSAHPFTNRKILVAEDYEGNIVVLKFLLDSMEIEYDIANNGAEAVRMYKVAPYPLVLMDVQMPEVDGFEATRQIRSYEEEEGLPATVIIAMTAHALAGDSNRCIAAGMNDYLSKPLMEADIRDKFAQHLFRDA